MEFLSNVPGVAPALAVKGRSSTARSRALPVLVAGYFYPESARPTWSGT